MGLATAETPPQGLDAYWLGVWRHALKTLKEQKSWAWEQKPLLDEYVFALIEADRARRHHEALGWHRASSRASQLADQLVLTPKSQRAHGVDSSEGSVSAFDKLG